jgi:TolA-binding protein
MFGAEAQVLSVSDRARIGKAAKTPARPGLSCCRRPYFCHSPRLRYFVGPMRTVHLLAAFGLVVSLAGCLATQKDQDALVARTAEAEKQAAAARAEAAAVRADLDATRQRLDNALRANADSSTESMSTKQRLNDLAGRLDEAAHNVDELKRDLAASRTEIYARVDEMKRAQQPAPAAPPIAVPADKASHAKQLQEAHARKDWPVVRTLAAEYVVRYPQDERADEALFYAGDGDLADGRPSSALGHFNRLIKLFPRSKFLDRTLFGMGEAYMLMHDCANAKLAYEACDRRFSKEKIGEAARAKLAIIAKNAPGTCAPQ